MTAGTGKARRLIRALPLALLDIVATGIACIAAAVHLDGAFVNCGLFKRQIPLRIIKMRPDFPVKMRGVFALPANEERTGFAAFPQVKSLCPAGLRNLQADFEYFTAASDQTRQFFAKPIFRAKDAAARVYINPIFEARAA